MCIHQLMYPMFLLIIMGTIRLGLDLLLSWRLVYIVPIIGVIMVAIMVVIIMVGIITLSLIMGTGIKLITTTIAEIDPLLCQIIWRKVITGIELQTGLEVDRLRLLVQL